MKHYLELKANDEFIDGSFYDAVKDQVSNRVITRPSDILERPNETEEIQDLLKRFLRREI